MSDSAVKPTPAQTAAPSSTTADAAGKITSLKATAPTFVPAGAASSGAPASGSRLNVNATAFSMSAPPFTPAASRPTPLPQSYGQPTYAGTNSPAFSPSNGYGGNAGPRPQHGAPRSMAQGGMVQGGYPGGSRSGQVPQGHGYPPQAFSPQHSHQHPGAHHGALHPSIPQQQQQTGAYPPRAIQPNLQNELNSVNTQLTSKIHTQQAYSAVANAMAGQPPAGQPHYGVPMPQQQQQQQQQPGGFAGGMPQPVPYGVPGLHGHHGHQQQHLQQQHHAMHSQHHQHPLHPHQHQQHQQQQQAQFQQHPHQQHPAHGHAPLGGHFTTPAKPLASSSPAFTPNAAYVPGAIPVLMPAPAHPHAHAPPHAHAHGPVAVPVLVAAPAHAPVHPHVAALVPAGAAPAPSTNTAMNDALQNILTDEFNEDENDIAEDDAEDEDEDDEEDLPVKYVYDITPAAAHSASALLTLREAMKERADVEWTPTEKLDATFKMLANSGMTEGAAPLAIARSTYPRNGGSRGGGMGGGRGGNRMSRLGGGNRGRHFDLKEYLPLVKSNTAYVVKRDVEGDEKVLREVMQVLNKLTDKNAEKLTDQILKMHITNEELLKQIVKAVFEKAVNEPHFSPVYASLCERLQGLSVHSATQQPKTAAEMMQSKQDKEKADKPFRRLMLLACQEKFSEYKFPTKEETEAAANDADATAKLLLSRRRFLNLMRFVGELFLCRNVLAANVVRICITTLFTTATSLGVPQAGETNWQPAEDQMIIEDAMEGLCRFLTTTGRLYTEAKNPQWQAEFDAVMARLKAIATIRDTDRLSSRIRFAIVDVVMLARNNWVPRVSGAAVSAPAPTPAAQPVASGDRYSRAGAAGAAASSSSSSSSSSSTSLGSASVPATGAATGSHRGAAGAGRGGKASGAAPGSMRGKDSAKKEDEWTSVNDRASKDRGRGNQTKGRGGAAAASAPIKQQPVRKPAPAPKETKRSGAHSGGFAALISDDDDEVEEAAPIPSDDDDEPVPEGEAEADAEAEAGADSGAALSLRVDDFTTEYFDIEDHVPQEVVEEMKSIFNEYRAGRETNELKARIAKLALTGDRDVLMFTAITAPLAVALSGTNLQETIEILMTAWSLLIDEKVLSNNAVQFAVRMLYARICDDSEDCPNLLKMLAAPIALFVRSGCVSIDYLLCDGMLAFIRSLGTRRVDAYLDEMTAKLAGVDGVEKFAAAKSA